MIVSRAIGAPLDRIDGPLKATGAAKYAFDYPAENVGYVYVVRSTIAKGRVASIDAGPARALAGVVTVVTHQNAPRVSADDDPALRVLQSDAVAYHGQIV
ncbi:MAG TPA: xanthine dehydrogenase family protein molybdopterin-binding subunit, partial [Xanthomonadales bacterium]|nr:xanthine dehydrogenase family protein molybdopterin-binding subunit [Xanthomonadales bacterium]